MCTDHGPLTESGFHTRMSHLFRPLQVYPSPTWAGGSGLGCRSRPMESRWRCSRACGVISPLMCPSLLSKILRLRVRPGRIGWAAKRLFSVRPVVVELLSERGCRPSLSGRGRYCAGSRSGASYKSAVVGRRLWRPGGPQPGCFSRISTSCPRWEG